MPQFVDYTGQKINNWDVIKQVGFNKHGESVWIAECDCENKTRIERILSSIKKSPKCLECINREKLEKRKKEIIGIKYGKLTIVGYYGYRDDVKSSSPYWIAKCDCGSDTNVLATHYDIKRGHPKSCGCALLKEPDWSLIGQKFGRLTVKEFLGRKNNQFVWSCDCDCGTTGRQVRIQALKSGATKSCGCWSTEVITKIGKEQLGVQKKFNQFIEKDNFVIGVTEEGREFIFDKDDLDKVKDSGRYWAINSCSYVLCRIDGKEYQLHRYLMELGFYNEKNDLIVDHINGSTLDNRKANLRICKKSDNPKNCNLYSNNTSGHKGVHWQKRLSKWQVSIQANKKSIYLGIYSNLEDAIKVRKEAEIRYFGEFSRDYRDEVIG